MTSEELKEAIKYLGISQGELARKLGNRPETINRWVNGVKGKLRNVPGPAATVINLWIKQKMEAESNQPEPIPRTSEAL